VRPSFDITPLGFGISIVLIMRATFKYRFMNLKKELAITNEKLLLEQERNRIAQQVHDTAGHTLTMRWEAEMQRIADRHPSNTCYLLPIIRTAGPHERSQYRTVQNRVNRHLKLVAGKAGIRQTLTMYCARHSWATIAREQKMPVSVISHAMGHTNERTTEVYLKGVDSAVIDRCNSAIISLLG